MRISPDIEHLHHHRWDFKEERGRGGRREKVKERKEKKNEETIEETKSQKWGKTTEKQ